jgi:hypothetical protein
MVESATMNFHTFLVHCVSFALWVVDVGLAVLFLLAEGALHLLWYVLAPIISFRR